MNICYLTKVNFTITGEIMECFQMNLGIIAHYTEKKLDTGFTPYKDELQMD